MLLRDAVRHWDLHRVDSSSGRSTDDVLLLAFARKSCSCFPKVTYLRCHWRHLSNRYNNTVRDMADFLRCCSTGGSLVWLDLNYLEISLINIFLRFL